MSIYTPLVDFSVKDTLPVGDPRKVAKGAELQDELNAIARVLLTKADVSSPQFAGIVEVPTPTASDKSSKAVNSWWVDNKLQSLIARLDDLEDLIASTPSAVPVGGIVYHMGSDVPSGYLKANGAAISRTVYPELFTAIGITYGGGNGTSTFNLPDARGEFIRGWDDGRGVDSGRVLGSAQTQSTENLFAQITGADGNVRLQYNRVSTPAWNCNRQDDDNNAGSSGTKTTGVPVSPMNTGETRPRNIAAMVLIRYQP